MVTAASLNATRDAASPDAVMGVQDAVREAVSRRMPLRVMGRGTWLDAGRPPASDARLLRLDALSGITRYTPGDLTLTAKAGTTLADVASATASEGQWLALDPFTGADHWGTLGATFATASTGPLSHALGLPRDVALGVEMVTGDGALVRAGGRVVKNVAGFDVTRLVTGSWGTLGVITEVTVRLRARPEIDRTLVLSVPSAPEAAGHVWARLREAPLSPIAAELLNPALVAHLHVAGTDPSQAVVLVRLGGNADRVAAEHVALSRLGPVSELTSDVWLALRRCEPTGAGAPAVVRWSHLPSRIDETWRHVSEACRRFPDAFLHSTLSRGVVRAILPHPEPSDLAAMLRGDRMPPTEFTGTRIAERLPGPLWATEAQPAVMDRLSRGVRAAFDPQHVLNTGILGETTGHG